MCVERHLEHRRDAAGRRAARAGLPAFPVRSTRLVEVDVGIHDARKHDEIARVDHLGAFVHFATDCRDDAMRYGDVGGSLAGGEDDVAAADDEIGGTHTSSITMSCAPCQSVSLPISGNCSCPWVTVAK